MPALIRSPITRVLARVIAGKRRSLDSFDDRRDTLTDADAHGRETVAAAALFHFMDEGRHDPGAAAAQRMSQGNGAAIDVESVETDAELAGAGKHLRCECLVDLDQIDLLDTQSCAFESFLRRRNGADAHVVGVDAGRGGCDDACQRFEL